MVTPQQPTPLSDYEKALLLRLLLLLLREHYFGWNFTTWTYTKIGRQVTISGVFVISSVASPVGATVIIGGLPFTIFNNNGAYGAFSAAYFTSATSADSAVSGRHSVNTTQLTLGVDASTVAASDEIYVKQPTSYNK
jgi:hypothetical protein